MKQLHILEFKHKIIKMELLHIIIVYYIFLRNLPKN